MQDDNLFVVVRQDNNKDQLLKFAIKMDSSTPAIAEDRVHLDHLMQVTIANGTYNSTTDKTVFPKPTGIESTTEPLAMYDIDTGNDLGRFSICIINGSNIEVTGNWENGTVYLGYLYNFKIQLPTIYVTQQVGEAYRADSRANTILHRASFAFGPIGEYSTTLSRAGRDDYIETFEITPANQYLANTATIQNTNKLWSIPIYDRNTNVTLFVSSFHPAPANILYMTWEGIYNNNFYKRV